MIGCFQRLHSAIPHANSPLARPGKLGSFSRKHKSYGCDDDERKGESKKGIEIGAKWHLRRKGVRGDAVSGPWSLANTSFIGWTTGNQGGLVRGSKRSLDLVIWSNFRE